MGRRSFLKHHQPRAVVLFELEFWPLFLLACARRRIPVIIVNARISERSTTRFRKLNWLFGGLWQGLRGAIAQNELWATRLRQLGIVEVSVAGSLKADAVQPQALSDALRARLCLTSGPSCLSPPPVNSPTAVAAKKTRSSRLIGCQIGR